VNCREMLLSSIKPLVYSVSWRARSQLQPSISHPARIVHSMTVSEVENSPLMAASVRLSRVSDLVYIKPSLSYRPRHQKAQEP
jgi:hypothetical protein